MGKRELWLISVWFCFLILVTITFGVLLLLESTSKEVELLNAW